MGTSLIPGPNGTWWPRDVNQRQFPPNEFNACLGDEEALWRAIANHGGLVALCPGVKYNEPPWVRMPPQGKRFSKISSLALPAADGLDHVVTSFYVPTGYDGCTVSVVNEYTGMGFQEGSGDLTWRIRLNQRYAKDFGAITTSIGNLTSPVNSGQILMQSRQLVQYIVNRSVASAGNLNGGRVVCAFFGWFWPR